MSNLRYPKYKGWKINGITVAAGCYLYTYEAGTTILKDTYSDSLETLNSNPVVLDSNGEADIFLGTGSYRVDLKTSEGALISTFDDITGSSDQTAVVVPSFPANCTLGETYFYDLPTTFDASLWTLDNTQIQAGSAGDTMIVGGTPNAYRSTDYSFFPSVVRASGMISAAYEFTSFSAKVTNAKEQNVGNSGSGNSAILKISDGPIIKASISGGAIFNIRVYEKDNLTLIYSSPNVTVGTGTYSYTTANVIEITRPTGTSGTFNVYINGALVCTYVEGTVGARTIYLESNYGNTAADYTLGIGACARQHGVWSELYCRGIGLPYACLGPNGLSVFTATLQGCTESPLPSVTVKYSRFENMVEFVLPRLYGTSNTATLVITGLPEELWPARTTYIGNIDCINDGVVSPATLFITTTGAMGVIQRPTFAAAPTTVFYNYGFKGTFEDPWTIVYPLS